jgi:hypothetical protein
MFTLEQVLLAKTNQFITNLTYNELIMKIMQSSFIHRFVHFTQISYIENTVDTQINVLME